MERAISLLGLLSFIAISYACSNNRRAINWTTVTWGIGLQFLLALFILKTPLGLTLFQWLGSCAEQFLNYADAGAAFVFGDNFRDHFFAFKVIPTIIFFSSCISLLYHYNILPRVIQALAWVMQRTMKTSGPESVTAATNIFVGQSAAPLVIKPYLPTITNSELHAVMTAGFATIAGGVLAAYISFGIAAEHLIAASVMSAPASLAIAKLFYPETEPSATRKELELVRDRVHVNAIDAAVNGAIEGMKLSLNVVAMLVAFLSLLALINGILGWVGGYLGLPQLSLEWLLSYLMAPLAWLTGVSWADCPEIAILLGKKTILNEFIAYSDLKELLAQPGPPISPRTTIIATYALCGFANIGSIAVQIGSISAIATNRQQDLAKLGVRAMIAGAISCFVNACTAGMLL